MDVITLQILHASFSGIVMETQNSLFRTGYSTIIRESQDASCALLDREGRVIAQHIVLPLHIGAFPACAQAVLKRYNDEIRPGDTYIINHPYEGGSPHTPDLGVITPIFIKDELFGFSANMAHKSDMGGSVPSSSSGKATELFQEGLLLPAIRYEVDYQPIEEITAIIASNSRTPDLVLGDIAGQIGSSRLSERRVKQLADKFGLKQLKAAVEQIYSITEKRVRQALREWPDGEYQGECWQDNDGIDLDRPLPVRVRVVKTGGEILFDFSETCDQSRGPANIRPPLVRAACLYCLTSLIDPYLPCNYGLDRSIQTLFRPGSLLDPAFPAPVNTYMPTAMAVCDSVFDALQDILPEKRIAASSAGAGFALGGRKTSSGQGYVQYELLIGGLGARHGKDGVSGTSQHISNARITPIEIIETEFPTRIWRFELIPDSGGPGRYRGGLGFVREYEILETPARLSVRADRFQVPPKGMAGGKSGLPGACIINPGTPQERSLPSRSGDIEVLPGDIIRVERGGGGGLGDPTKRERQRVLTDAREGYISIESAKNDYGVEIRAEDLNP
jgi:N-methylhydantoinase B